MSHPSRVRELKLRVRSKINLLKLSHPSRVRELKQSSLRACECRHRSHPSRVRELKRVKIVSYLPVVAVAPLPGA